MSYKSTRIYDFKLLDRLIDYDTLVDNAIAALSEFGEKNYIDGFVSCTLELNHTNEIELSEYEIEEINLTPLSSCRNLKGFNCCSLSVTLKILLERTLFQNKSPRHFSTVAS